MLQRVRLQRRPLLGLVTAAALWLVDVALRFLRLALPVLFVCSLSTSLFGCGSTPGYMHRPWARTAPGGAYLFRVCRRHPHVDPDARYWVDGGDGTQRTTLDPIERLLESRSVKAIFIYDPHAPDESRKLLGIKFDKLPCDKPPPPPPPPPPKKLEEARKPAPVKQAEHPVRETRTTVRTTRRSGNRVCERRTSSPLERGAENPGERTRTTTLTETWRCETRPDPRYIGQTPPKPPGKTAPDGYYVAKGRPGEQPWDVWMGNAAHELIAYHYEATHPDNLVAKNSVAVQEIVGLAGGDTKLVLPNEAKLRPDITNIQRKEVFEIKKHGEEERKAGLAEVTLYLNALNRAMPATNQFTRGTGFSNALGVRFADGVAPWQLSWQTTEPGVVQYRWQRLNPKDQALDSYREAYEQGRWVDVSTAEMEQYGEKLYQAVQTIVQHRNLLEQIRTGVSVPIAITGITASAVLMGAMDQMMSSKAPLSPAAPTLPPPMPRPVAPPAPALPPRPYIPPPSMRPTPRPPAPPLH